MYRLIILAVISVALYGQGQSCESTYRVANFTAIRCQYSNYVDCSGQCSNVTGSIVNHLSYIMKNLSDIVNNEVFQFNRSKEIFNNRSEIIMETFTPICQRYTDVMAHKYYLKYLLFNKTNLNSTVIIKLVLIVIDLQVLAKYYHTAQVCVHM